MFYHKDNQKVNFSPGSESPKKITTEKRNSPQGSYRLPPGPVFFNPENFISGTYHYISGVSLNDQLECSQFKENL